MSSTSLYEKVGGKEGVESLIFGFYAQVKNDPVLAPFFERTSFDKLRAMQVEFFTMALGGPVEYSGQSLGAAHHGRGIGAEHMTRFVGHLISILESKGMGEEDVEQVIDRINRRSNEVLGVSY